MKFVGIFAAAMVAATSATAFDLGNGLRLGGEVETTYTTSETDNFGLNFTPEVGFNAMGLDLSAETTFDMLELNNEAVDTFTGVDFEATYEINGYLEAFGEVSADSEWEFGDVTVGTRLSF